MNRSTLFLIALVALCGSTLSCTPTLDLPPQPDIQPVLDDFNDPDANVTGPIMAEVAQLIEEVFEDSQSSDFYNEILDVIISVQEELDESTDEEGNLELEGIGTFPAPNGALEIDYTCTGWGGSETDPENGTLTLAMTLVGGNIGALVWGFAENCKFLVDGFQASYDGDIAVYLGEAVATSEPIDELEIIFAALGTVGFDGGTLNLDEAFRITESGRFDLLVQLDDGTAFIYFFESDSSVQGIIDVTGTFGCSLESQECQRAGQDPFSW